MKSLKGYFEYIDGKTYIDKYPSKIIRQKELHQSILIEFGGGIGNDMEYMISSLGLHPKNLFFIESDERAFKKAFKKLFTLFGRYRGHLILCDIFNFEIKPESADLVYANNFLHCLETRKKVKMCLKRAYKILRKKGIFFGRTVGKIDMIKLKKLEKKKKKSFSERFIIKTTKAFIDGKLLLVTPENLKELALSVGFKRITIVWDKSNWKPVRDYFFRLEKGEMIC